MIRIGICDDERKYRKNIMQSCQAYFDAKGIEYELAEYTCGEEFLQEDHPDILLLDITMRQISGLLVKDILAKMHAKTRIVFVSENKNLMSQAFGRNVFGFLIKPINDRIFCEKMDEVLEDISESKAYVYCKNGEDIERIYLKRILYIESFGRYTKLYIQGEKEYKISHKGIRKWCEILPSSSYAQCNRNQVVNLMYVTKMQNEIEMINGERISLSKHFEENFREKYKVLKGK